MRTAESAPENAIVAPVRRASVTRTRLADYLELIRPRIAVLALVTVAVGYSLGAGDGWRLVPLLHALCGIALVAAASSTLNQFIERDTDAGMQRTANRPLPAGRLSPVEALCFGLVAATLGCLYLALMVNALTAVLALATCLIYTLAYTPLKRLTFLCTTIGAIPGALPPVLGWTAAGGQLDSGALALFAVLFLWQFPHFLAIGWLYHDDYQRAGLRMLPTKKRVRRVTGLLCVGYALVLLPVSLLPSRLAMAGDTYSLTAIILGVGYLLCAVRFAIRESEQTARELIYSSLLYLPLLLLTMTWDHFHLLR